MTPASTPAASETTAPAAITAEAGPCRSRAVCAAVMHCCDLDIDVVEQPVGRYSMRRSGK